MNYDYLVRKYDVGLLTEVQVLVQVVARGRCHNDVLGLRVRVLDRVTVIVGLVLGLKEDQVVHHQSVLVTVVQVLPCDALNVLVQS